MRAKLELKSNRRGIGDSEKRQHSKGALLLRGAQKWPSSCGGRGTRICFKIMFGFVFITKIQKRVKNRFSSGTGLVWRNF